MSRIAAIRAVAARMYGADNDAKPLVTALAPAKTTTKTPAAPSAQKSSPAPVAKVQTKPAPKPSAPPRKLGRVETVALAVRTNPALRGLEDIALNMLDEDPDLRGVTGDGIVKLLLKVNATAYRAEMAERERAATKARSDAVWERAIAKVYGHSAAQPETASSDVWDRAIAKLYRGSAR